MTSAWCQTFLGHAFDPLEPRAEDINIRDIAHSLALQCRFHGHTRVHSSVAQHSVYVMLFIAKEATGPSPRLPQWAMLAALLHDAHEAYLGDLSRPVKHIPELRAVYMPIEEGVQRAVHERFGLPWPLPDAVGKAIAGADNLGLALEKRDQMCRPPQAWAPLPEVPADPPRGISLVKPWDAERAEVEFLHEFWGCIRRGEGRV